MLLNSIRSIYFSVCRSVRFPIRALILVATTAVASPIALTQSDPNTAMIDQAVQTGYDTDNSDPVRPAGGLVCYNGDRLSSSEDNLPLQALYLKVGPYQCLRRYGAWKHTISAIDNPPTTRRIRSQSA